MCRIRLCAKDYARGNGGNGAYLMYENSSAGVSVVRGFLLSGSSYLCPTVECILCSKNVYIAHCMKQ